MGKEWRIQLSVLQAEMCKPYTQFYLKIQNIGMANLQETQILGSGSLKEHSTFFWQGRWVNEYREHEVEFTGRNTLLHMIVSLASVTEIILMLFLLYTWRPCKPCAHLCTNTPSHNQVKDQFYAQLDSVVKHIASYEYIYFLGDANGRVGANQVYWSNVLGHHCIGKMNENDRKTSRILLLS